MKTLHIIASPRKDRSKSRHLGEFLASKLEGEVVELDLYESEIPYVSNDLVTYNYGYMKYEDLSPNDKKIADLQRKYIDQIKGVDNVIVSAPLWNFGMPAILKGYIDLIVKVGDTFKMTESGLEGLLTNIKNLYIVEAKGSIYKGTDWESVETLDKNIRQAFAFIGVTNAKTFSIEGVTRKDDETLNADIKKLEEEIEKSI